MEKKGPVEGWVFLEDFRVILGEVFGGFVLELLACE